MSKIIFLEDVIDRQRLNSLSALSGTIYPTSIRSTGIGWAFGVGRVGAILVA
jgi:hypothetical protein